MKFLKFLPLLIVSLFIASCATAKPEKETSCPEWTMNGAKAWKGYSDNAIYGTGVAENISTFSLLKDTADAAARNAVAAKIEVFTDSLLERYRSDGNMDKESTNEALVKSALKQTVKQSLRGVEIVARCHNEGAVRFHSLAMLKKSNIKDVAAENEKLPKKLKEELKKNADEMLGKL